MINILANKVLHWTGGIGLCALVAGSATIHGGQLPFSSGADETVDVQVDNGLINPDNWPRQERVIPRNLELEARIDDLLSRMTLEEKVGQIIQADIGSVTPEDAARYHLGSVLNGGNSAPEGNLRIEAQAWLELADEFWIASTDTTDGGVGIPIMWGTDAVHGHSNILGATIFPHNIGLGAANNPPLMKRIGEVTAQEMLVTGVDWTFAPTVAIARDDRWGRTYESFSEAPEIVATYAAELVTGLQGEVNTNEFLDENHMIATVKHFVGDGGTVGGSDQGDNQYTEENLRDLQAAGYPPAIRNGVQVVMASFNSFHGRKLHGYRELLTDVLVGRMAFDGFVVGDWNGHGQVEGCTNLSCPQSINAGIDMLMAPDSWRDLYRNTLLQVQSGEISAARLDQAVSRILRVKLRAGLLDAGLPSRRSKAGTWNALGSAPHRAVARQAVRESLVLLKNNGNTLPINPVSTVLVAGDGADNIAKQSGGWTLSWQGTGNTNDDFPNGQSIFHGLKEAIEATGGKVQLSEDGSYSTPPDVAVIVFGEEPYAEFQGDVDHVDFEPTGPLRLLRNFKASGIPTVSVFLSGRPMWVNPEINASDAFVAAWLPGSEGGGVADVLIGKPDGSAGHDFKGRLSFSWPKAASGLAPNIGDKDYDPLFAYGYGLTYAAPKELPQLSENGEAVSSDGLSRLSLITAGTVESEWYMILEDSAGSQSVANSVVRSPMGSLQTSGMDYLAQEDSRLFSWSGPASLRLLALGQPVDFDAEVREGYGLEFTYRVISTSRHATFMGMTCGEDCESNLDISGGLAEIADKEWRTTNINLKCFADMDFGNIESPFFIRSDEGLQLQIASVRFSQNNVTTECSL